MDYLYKFFLLRLKLLLFMIWDIDDYIGNDSWNYIKCVYDDNFKVENNKEDLLCYDLENNMEFFNRLYILIGFVPYNENPLELTVYSEPISKIKNMVEKLERRLTLFYNSKTWSRGFFYNITNEQINEILLIEKEVKNWIISFLEEAREEWVRLLRNESIEMRNLRLLNEIEELLKI